MGALGLTFLVFFGASMRVALWAREVQVPSLIGRTVNEATATLADRDLALRVEENQRPDDKIEAGTVMQQEPDAGATSRQAADGARLDQLWTQADDRAATGRTERARRTDTTAAGRRCASPPSPSSDRPTTRRMSSWRRTLQRRRARPRSPFSSIAANCRPPTSCLMSSASMANAPPTRSAARVSASRLLALSPTPGCPPGIVVRQQPAGGFRVGGSDAISLEVSR